MKDSDYQQIVRAYHHLYKTTKPKPPCIRIHMALILATFISSSVIVLVFKDKEPPLSSHNSSWLICLDDQDSQIE